MSPDPTEQARLAAVAAYEVIGAGPDDPTIADLNALCELAATLAGLPNAVVNLFDDRFQHQVAAYGVDPAPCRADESMCQTTLAAGHDIAVPDAGSDERFASSPWVDGRLARIRCYCSVVLRSPDGLALGTLCVFDERVGELTAAQLRGLQLISRQVLDVLELRRQTRLLEQSNAELSRSQDRLASFAGQISHDLKAPITAILGFAELLSDLGPIETDPSAAAYVARCSSAARRMLAMIDDLLAFARVGATLTPVPNALDDLMPQIVDDLGQAADGVDVSWSGPEVVADRSQLRALLQNLVGNAVKYRGEEPLRIRVVSERSGASTVLHVIDNGPGIPVASREEVLRPLARLRKDVPGAGLGLAVCVRVMAAHGGRLRIGETPGGGTTVTAVFPD